LAERILIVDDQQSIQLLLSRVCRREGFDVQVAGDATSALQLLETTPIDIGIFDLRLPERDLSGIDVLRRAKELYPFCEVIILTGHAELATAVEAMRLGAYDYLEKPVPSVHMISMVIRRAIERQRLSRQNLQLLDELQYANQELESRRSQQLAFVRDLGQALASSMQLDDLSDVLVRAILSSLQVDGAGLLLLPFNGLAEPTATLGGQAPLTSGNAEALVDGLTALLPTEARTGKDLITRRLLAQEAPGSEGEPWQTLHGEVLTIDDTAVGAVVLARHSAEPFNEETLGILRILINQLSISLKNTFLFARMRELATRDSLTKLYNHGHFFELLEAEISRSERHLYELAVIMLDMDRSHGLKHVNDSWGHQAGDRLLVSFAELLLASVRRADVAARYGGDEFIILAPQTSPSQALALAERLCSTIRQTPFAVAPDAAASVTVSVGVCVFRPGESESASSVVARADMALYRAKEQGGNQVCESDPSGPEEI
jgi:diguanylate cyclase (GGDEF)-like protein